jgi:formate transporter
MASNTPLPVPGQFPTMDSLLPPEMALKAEDIGVRKSDMDGWSIFVLAILAGAFIAFGAIFATVSLCGTSAEGIPFGWGRVLAGAVFTLGLVLVVIAGAELFTGNNLLVMAWASGRISTFHLLRNWAIVYAGNFVGSIGIALLTFFARHYMLGKGAVGLTALSIGNSKMQYGFIEAVALGTLCNALVCLAVWMTYSARTATDRFLVILLPIAAFVAAGFEHSVANMYFIPIGLLIKATAGPEFWQAIGKTAADFGSLTWGAFFLKNLLPVTIGNILGGTGCVGLVYWFIFLRPRLQSEQEMAPETLAVEGTPVPAGTTLR